MMNRLAIILAAAVAASCVQKPAPVAPAVAPAPGQQAAGEPTGPASTSDIPPPAPPPPPPVVPLPDNGKSIVDAPADQVLAQLTFQQLRRPFGITGIARVHQDGRWVTFTKDGKPTASGTLDPATRAELEATISAADWSLHPPDVTCDAEPVYSERLLVGDKSASWAMCSGEGTHASVQAIGASIKQATGLRFGP